MYQNARKKERTEEKEKGESEPHRDWKTNKDRFDRWVKAVQFAPEVKIEVQKDTTRIPTCALLVFGTPPSDTQSARRIGAFCISFHQDVQSFKFEICGIFNSMGQRGLLRRKIPPKPKEPTDWEKLFP